MTDSNLDELLIAISQNLESTEKYTEKLKLLIKKSKEKEPFDKESLLKEIHEQDAIMKQSLFKIKLNLKPGTVIPGIEDEDAFDFWREEVQKDKYPITEYLEQACYHYEDTMDNPDCAEMLMILLKFPFFKPDLWCKKEDELRPLYIKGAGIPGWLSNRYREALYSYIYGFNNAAIALCRSIVEGIINNKLENISNKTDLKEKIEYYVKTVNDTEHKQAAWNTHKVRISANDVLHDIQKPANDKLVKKTLLVTRDFIKSVY